MTDHPTPTARAPRVRAAILRDMRDAQHPLRMRDMTRALRTAANLRELNVVLHRMHRSGALRRYGAGYHYGEPYRYWPTTWPQTQADT